MSEIKITPLKDRADEFLIPEYHKLKRAYVDNLEHTLQVLGRALGVSYETCDTHAMPINPKDPMDFNGCGISCTINDRYWAFVLTKNGRSCYLLAGGEKEILISHGPMLHEERAEYYGAPDLAGKCSWHFDNSFRYDPRKIEIFASLEAAFLQAVKLSPKRD